MSFSGCASGSEEYWKIAIKALQKIDIREETYIDYGSKYTLGSRNCELIKLRQLQNPRYHSLLVTFYLFSVLRTVQYVVKFLADPCILVPYRFRVGYILYVSSWPSKN